MQQSHTNYVPSGIDLCKLCLEESNNILRLTNGYGFQNDIGRILQKHFRCTIAISGRQFDCICGDCWHKVKDFDDFCNHIAYVHQLQTLNAGAGTLQHTTTNHDLQCVQEYGEIDAKPTPQQLQAAMNVQENNAFVVNSSSKLQIAAVNCGINVEALEIIETKHEPASADDSYRTDNAYEFGDRWADNGAGTDSDDYPTAFDTPKGKKSNKKKVLKMGQPKVKHEPEQMMYVCELCGHTSKSKGVYDNHYESKHMNNTYDCDVCGERFRSKHCIYTHMRRIHIRKLHEQFLQCSICSKKVSQRCFRSHLERHNKEQMCRYKCFMCNKGFLTKDKLKEHETIHTGELPLKCAECDKRFRFSSSLSLHRKKVHRVSTEPPKKYKCHFCENIYSSPSTRYTHRKRHHPNEIIPV